jgi:hypothetical protein
MKTKYSIEISFHTDRKLNADELDHLLNAVAVQVEDPSGLNGNKRAEFTVSEISYAMKANEWTFLRVYPDGTQTTEGE